MTPAEHAATVTPRILVSYPIPFAGAIGELRLPQGFTREEAERVKAIIDALVIDPTEPSS